MIRNHLTIKGNACYVTSSIDSYSTTIKRVGVAKTGVEIGAQYSRLHTSHTSSEPLCNGWHALAYYVERGDGRNVVGNYCRC